MADNQLLRESSPRPGSKPGVIPQHRKQGTQQFEDTEGSNGALHTKIVDVNGNPIYTLPVQLTGSKAVEHTFHTAKTAASYGTELVINGGKTLVVEIFGDGTGLVLPFEGAVYGANYTRISGVLLSDMSTANNSTGTSQIWQFDVTGLNTVRIVVQSIASGQVTIKGRLVS